MSVWRMYPVLVDFLLYFFVFSAVARVSLSKSFPNHEGKVLSVSVGLILAAGLAMAQRRLGFSVERFGPIAVFFLCGLLVLVAYKFLERGGISRPISVLIAFMLGVALLRTAMPSFTGEILRNNPLATLLVLAGLVYWTWRQSQKYAVGVDKRRPGSLLAKDHDIPDASTVKKEKKFVKKRMLQPAQQARKTESKLSTQVKGVLKGLDGNEPNPEARQKMAGVLSNMEKAIARLRSKTQALMKMDDAIKRFDVKWFREGRGIDLSNLTPDQQSVLRDTLLVERRRAGIEEALEKVTEATAAHTERMQAELHKGRKAFESGSGAGATGWLDRMVGTLRETEALENRIIHLEKTLLHMLKTQQKILDRPAKSA